MAELVLRSPLLHELPTLSALCLRSKASWGYDHTFMTACRDELTLSAQDLQDDLLQVALENEAHLGVVQVAFETHRSGSTAVPKKIAVLEKLFIDPKAFGRGVGECLYHWARDHAIANGAQYMEIDADPGAEGFYKRMGAQPQGMVSSASIAGRNLPQLRDYFLTKT